MGKGRHSEALQSSVETPYFSGLYFGTVLDLTLDMQGGCNRKGAWEMLNSDPAELSVTVELSATSHLADCPESQNAAPKQISCPPKGDH